VRASGAELGIRTVAIPRAQVTLALWTLALESELVFVGDAGTTTAGRPTRRAGVEMAAYFSPTPNLHVDVDAALSRARFSDRAEEGSEVPGAVGAVVSAGVSLDGWRGLSGGVRWRYIGSRPLIEDGSVRSRAGGTVTGRIGYHLTPRLRFDVQVFNLFNAAISDIDYFYVSRLPHEPAEGVADRHTHPMPPRTARAGLTVLF
jgi:hypothetical protein